MKIGIDGIPLTIPFPCGTKHYSEQLIKHLAKIDKNNQYIILVSQKITIPGQRNFRFVKIPSFLPILKRQLFLAHFAYKEKLDVFHYLEPYGAIFFKHPKIVTTVHDLDLNYTYPWFSKYLLKRIYCETTRKAVVQNSSFFIAVSKSIKEELIKQLKNKNNLKNIFVVNNGVNKNFRVIKPVNRSTGNFFLSMGDFTPRKNVERVMESYKLLPQSIKNSHRLKIVTSTLKAKNNFIQKAQECNLTSSIDVLENVKLSNLIRLYNKATAFIYPSSYEGFGIPILEAMACGCPVITSNYGAMKEVAGDAAYLVNPKSAREIAKAMEIITKDKKLTNTLKLKGLKRIRSFSWKKTAQKTLKVYESAFKA